MTGFTKPPAGAGLNRDRYNVLKECVTEGREELRKRFAAWAVENGSSEMTVKEVRAMVNVARAVQTDMLYHLFDGLKEQKTAVDDLTQQVSVREKALLELAKKDATKYGVGHIQIDPHGRGKTFVPRHMVYDEDGARYTQDTVFDDAGEPYFTIKHTMLEDKPADIGTYMDNLPSDTEGD